MVILSLLPDAPEHALIPKDAQNESLPAYKKFQKTTTTITTIAALKISMHVLMIIHACSRSHRRVSQS
jgi:hypothetical protein